MTWRGGDLETWTVLISLSAGMGFSTFILTNHPLIAACAGTIGVLLIALSPRGRRLWKRRGAEGPRLAPLEDVARPQTVRPVSASQTAHRPFTLRDFPALDLYLPPQGRLSDPQNR